MRKRYNLRAALCGIWERVPRLPHGLVVVVVVLVLSALGVSLADTAALLTAITAVCFGTSGAGPVRRQA
ncbi:hypothetical protein OG280_41200 (plasmid) [Streptomyces virginiae]|uniref:hypothetical protein n=1 Tax=Streptomyces virginiae TaxID=1961 RepID=UPI002DDC4698|nr:hypothetical protein [Streptomyces virginiae]WSC82695.1 hypothetical protein OHA56_41060 [Streptomyces virginiae]